MAAASGPMGATQPHTASLSEISKRIQNESSVDDLVRAVTELKAIDSTLFQSDGTHQQFFNHVIPLLINKLRSTQPVLEVTNKLQIARHTMLDILHRLPSNEAIRTHVESIMDLAIQLMDTDNEENSLVCIKIIIDLQRNYRPHSIDTVKRLLLVIQRMLRFFPVALQSLYDMRLWQSSPAAIQAAQLAVSFASLAHQQAQQALQQAQQSVQHQTSQAQRASTAAQQAQQALQQANVVHHQATQSVTNLTAQLNAAPPGPSRDNLQASLDQAKAIQQQHAQPLATAQQASMTAQSQYTLTQQQLVHAQTSLQQATQVLTTLASALTNAQNQLAIVQRAAEAAAAAASGKPAPPAPATPMSAASTGHPVLIRPDGSRALARGLYSFRVVSECPVVIVLFFQMYKDLMRTHVPTLIPLAVSILSYSARLPQQPPRIAKELFQELVTCQVKMLSILAYFVSRNFIDVLRAYESLPQHILQLLQNLPPELLSTRKELIIATRHFFASELRTHFQAHVDSLLNESTILGRGWTATDTLRPLAISSLADFVIAPRSDLTPPQLTRTVHFFLRYLKDPTLPMAIHVFCSKIIVHLIESVQRKLDPLGPARQLVMHILAAFIRKLGSIADWHIPLCLRSYQRKEKSDASSGDTSAPSAAATSAVPAGAAPAAPVEAEETMSSEQEAAFWEHMRIKLPDLPGDLGVLTPLKCRQVSELRPASAQDIRTLLKSLMGHLKTICWALVHINQAAMQATNSNARSARLLSPDETFLFVHLLRDGLRCFDIFRVTPDGRPCQLRGNVTAKQSPEEKETIEAFSSLFSNADVFTFREVFASRMELLVESIIDDVNLTSIPQSLLSYPSVSPYFGSSLLEYLVRCLPQLGGEDKHRSMVLLRLFKLMFGSVSLFAEQNESVLHPHLADLIHRSLELCSTVKDPLNYFMLLRALFRSIGGGKFEQLYKEFLPLLPTLLTGLNRLQDGAYKQQMKELFVELCLTVPVRLSALLPYLQYLMRPLVLALNSSEELVTQGLRTLELCIDNLTPEFLNPNIEPVRAELMDALWRHLRPSNGSTNTATVTWRILGKLGGRSRLTLRSAQLTPIEPTEPCAAARVFCEGDTTLELPLEGSVAAALTVLRDGQDERVRAQALTFLSAVVATFFHDDVDNWLNLAPHASRVREQWYLNFSLERPARSPVGVFVQAVNGLILAAADKSLATSAGATLTALVRRCVVLSCLSADVERRPTKMVHPETFVEALVLSLACEDQAVISVAREQLALTFKVLEQFAPSRAALSALPLLGVITHLACVSCYRREWLAKAAGCTTISVLLQTMHPEWLRAHLIQLSKALFFVTMDLTNEIGGSVADTARELFLEQLVPRVLSEPPLDLTMRVGEATTDTELGKFVKLLATELSSPDQNVRSQVKVALSLLSEKTGMSITALLQTTMLKESIIPRTVRNSPVHVQIGKMDALAFCLRLDPPLREFVPQKVVPATPVAASPSANPSAAAAASTTSPAVTQASAQLNAAAAGVTAGPSSVPLDLPDSNTTYLTEITQICKLDDNTARAQTSRPGMQMSPSLLLTYRVRALDLLAVAIANPAWADLRRVALEQFVRALASQHQEVVTVALQGLRALQVETTMPKEALEAVIRPLLDLSDFRKLTVPLLRTLSHLVGLFPNLVNARALELLGDFLTMWLDQITQDVASSNKLWREPEGVAIVSAILDVLACFGPSGDRQLEPLLEAVLTTEARLGRVFVSPFRKSLFKFLACFPERTIDHLLDKVASAVHVRLLVRLVKDTTFPAFRTALLAKVDVLMAKGFDVGRSQLEALASAPPAAASNAAAASALLYNSLVIFRALSAHGSEFLTQGSPLAEKLHALLISPIFRVHMAQEDCMSCTRVAEPLLLIHLLLSYARRNLEDTDVLLRLLELLQVPTLLDMAFLRRFFLFEVPRIYPLESRRALLLRGVALMHDRNVRQDIKADLFEKVLVVLISSATERGDVEALLGSGEEGFVSKYVRVGLLHQASVEYEDCMKLAIIQVILSLVTAAKQFPPILQEMTGLKQEYLGFVWNYCYFSENAAFSRVWSLDDIAVKYSGYVVVSALMKLFDYCPAKMLLPLYDSLLEAHSAEHRALAFQAADNLIPLLSRYIPAEADGRVQWVTRLREPLSGDMPSHTYHVWDLIVHKSDVYYAHSATLLPWLVQSLSRLSSSPPTTENRRYSVELIELILEWETRRAKEAQDAGASFVSALAARQHETIVMLLMHSACQIAENPTEATLLAKVLALLDSILKRQMWSLNGVSIARFEKILQNIPTEVPLASAQSQASQSTGIILMTFRIITSLLSRLPRDVMVSKVLQIRTGLVNAVMTRVPQLLAAFCEILKLIATAYPVMGSADRTPIAEFDALFRTVRSTFEEAVAQLERSGSPAQPAGSQLHASLMHIQALVSVSDATFVAECAPSLIKIVQKYQKDQSVPPGTAGVVPLQLTDDHFKQIATVLDITGRNMSAIEPTLRKALLLSVLGLLDKVTNVSLLKTIVTFMAQFACQPESPGLLVKDRAIVLHRLITTYTKRFSKDAIPELLQMVLEVFRTPALANSEMTVRLESGFMLGLRAADLETREAFFALFDQDNSGQGLFNRLEWCLSERTCKWDAGRGTFWLKHVLDVALSAATPSFAVDSCGWAMSTGHLSRSGAASALGAAPMYTPEFVQALSEDKAWFASTTRTMRDLVVPLRTLCHLQPQLAFDLWVALFPQIWATFDEPQQAAITAALTSLLQQDYLNEQNTAKPSSVQALVAAVAACTKNPASLPPYLLLHLAKTHGTWHQSLALLRLQQSRAEARDARDGTADAAKDSQAALLLMLSEHDSWIGHQRQRWKSSPDTLKALAFEQLGDHEGALAQYESLMSTVSVASNSAREPEFRLWEDRWLHCTQQLGQHEVLARVAEETRHADIMVQSALRLRNWKKLKETLARVEPQRDPTPELKIARAYAAVGSTEQQAVSIEKHVTDAAHLLLTRWMTLPALVSVSHAPLLHMFQQLVEVQESHKLIDLVLSGVQKQDLTNTFETWRHRLPNAWDDLSFWHDILGWRCAIFEKLVLQQFRPKKDAPNAGSQLTLPGQVETASTMSQLAVAARLQRQRTLAQRIVTQMGRQPNLTPDDHFFRLRETLKLEVLNDPHDLRSQLDVLAGANMSTYSRPQNAELLSIKGNISTKLEDYEAANKAYCASLMLHEEYVGAWEGWGELCQRVATREANPEQHAQWATAAMVCLLQALRSHSEDEPQRRLATRTLLLLALEPDVVGPTFQAFSEHVDPMLWRPWIPQMLSAMPRPDGRHLCPTLTRVARVHPNALYYALRTTYLDLRSSLSAGGARLGMTSRQASSTNVDAGDDRKRGADDASSSTKRVRTEDGAEPAESTPGAASTTTDSADTRASPLAQALQNTSQIMHHLRSRHALLATALETMIDEIVTKLKPTGEEEMLRTLQVLLAECLKQAFTAMERPLSPTESRVSSSIAAHLRKVADSFLMAPGLQHYRERFKADFDHIDECSVDAGLQRLRAWHTDIAEAVSRLPRHYRLEDLSRFLTAFSASYADIEMPGEHLERRNMQALVKIERFVPDILAPYKLNSTSRRLGIRGRNGRVYHFLVQSSLPKQARAEERILQLLRSINTLLDRCPQARARGLALSLPRMAPLNPHVRLVQEEPSTFSLEDVLAEHCAQHELAVDSAVSYSYETRKAELARTDVPPEHRNEPRRAIFNHVCKELVPADVLSRYAKALHPDFTALWLFRRQFTSQIALWALMTYVLGLTKPLPHALKIVATSGHVLFWELAFSMDGNGLLTHNDRVHFRLTPSLQHFITPVGLSGIFSGCFLAGAQALADPEQWLSDHAGIIVRDEMVSWAGMAAPRGLEPDSLAHRLRTNLENIQRRVATVAGPEGGQPLLDTLVKSATNPALLCLNAPTWHPWL